MKFRLLLSLLLVAIALPLVVVSCKDEDSNIEKPSAAAKPTPEAKHHYVVAMTGIT